MCEERQGSGRPGQRARGFDRQWEPGSQTGSRSCWARRGGVTVTFLSTSPQRAVLYLFSLGGGGGGRGELFIFKLTKTLQAKCLNWLLDIYNIYIILYEL